MWIPTMEWIFFCFVSAQFRISCFFSVSFLVRLLYRAAVGVYISTSLLKSSDFVHDKKIAISQSCFHFFHLITYLKFWIYNFNATWFFAKNEFPSLCRLYTWKKPSLGFWIYLYNEIWSVLLELFFKHKPPNFEERHT